MTLKTSTYKKTPEYSPTDFSSTVLLKKKAPRRIRLEKVNYFALTGTLQDALPICTNNCECAEVPRIQVCQLLGNHRRSECIYSTSASSQRQNTGVRTLPRKKEAGWITEKACHRRHKTALICFIHRRRILW